MAYLVDESAAAKARAAQQQREARRGTKKERKQARFNAQIAASGVRIKQLPPGPRWQPKLSRKRLKARELERLRDQVKTLEYQVIRLSKSRNTEFYDSPEWHKARYEALKRSNGCCQLCGSSRSTGAIIQVDHIKPRSKYPALSLEPNNLQVLCRPCNMGKGNRDSIDWRRPELKVIRGS